MIHENNDNINEVDKANHNGFDDNGNDDNNDDDNYDHKDDNNDDTQGSSAVPYPRVIYGPKDGPRAGLNHLALDESVDAL